jgi:hypothetical protein
VNSKGCFSYSIGIMDLKQNPIFLAVLVPAWFAVDLVSMSTFGKSKWAGLTCIGWQGIRMGYRQPCLRLGFELSLPMEPELPPCGWRCPHRRPTVMGSTGNLVILFLTSSKIVLFKSSSSSRWLWQQHQETSGHGRRSSSRQPFQEQKSSRWLWQQHQ